MAERDKERLLAEAREHLSGYSDCNLQLADGTLDRKSLTEALADFALSQLRAANERITELERQLAEARAQGMREAAEIARRYKDGYWGSDGPKGYWHCKDRIAEAIERAAEAQKKQHS